MNTRQRVQRIYSSNVSEFQSICGLYKSMLDKNYGGRFCIGEHCKTVFMIEISFDGRQWGATPKVFNSKEEAAEEAEVLKQKYFASEYRIITRKVEENRKKH